MIGFLGGTGPEGRGLAVRFALAGEAILLGSRDQEKARQAAAWVLGKVPHGSVLGVTNQEAAERGDIIFIMVPFPAHAQLLESVSAYLEHKVVVDVVSPLIVEDRQFKAVAVPEGSVAQQAQVLLPSSQIVAAFHNISAVDLLEPAREIRGDVVVCSDHPEARKRIMALAEVIPGIRAINGSALSNSRYVEELTALLLNLNKVYKTRAMVRFLGIQTPES